MKELQSLQYDFRVAVSAYVNAFCKKHGWRYEADGWVSGDVGGVILIGDRYIDFDDIRTDIDNEFEKDAFVEWYDYSQRCAELRCPKRINYKSFAMGAPLPYSKDVLDNIAKMQMEIEKLKDGAEE